MWKYLKLFLILNTVKLICSKQENIADDGELNTKVLSLQNYIYWPNGTIPFYIEPEHFDSEQSLAIMRSLAMFTFKTCLKFLPVLQAPRENSRVMTFINPDGHRRCKLATSGNSLFDNFKVQLGYDCLKAPQIYMVIMRALGFPFEHNRLSRTLYIQVLTENIDASAVEYFTRDLGLPPELRALPYDVNSVTHFGERDYSSNGHKTIRFLNKSVKQHRGELTETDLRKIEIVYGEECRKRDRQEKIELCHSYPGVGRKKREVETAETVKSLRVNPNITPPPAEIANKTAEGSSDNNITHVLKELGVDEQAQTLVDNLFKLSSAALVHAREKLCKNKEDPSTLPKKSKNNQYTHDVMGILELIGDYAIETVQKAVSNLTIYCEAPESLAVYQRSQCDWRIDSRCRERYFSTKSGNVFYSTHHRPWILQSTNIVHGLKYSYDHVNWRSGNTSEESTTPQVARKKREVTETEKTPVVKEKDEKVVKSEISVTPSAGGAASTNGLSSVGIKRRFFERRSYKTGKTSHKSEAEWAASDLSGEKEVSSGREMEIANVAEINDPPSLNPAKGGKGNQETTDFGKKVSREVVLGEENVAKDIEKDENETEGASAKQNKDYAKIKSKNKIKIKDTFESLDKNFKILTGTLKEVCAISLRVPARITEKTKSPKLKKRAHDVPETVKLTKLNKEFYNERRWPEGVLRYVISPQEEYDLEDLRSRLGAVADILKERTCVTLQEVTEDEAINYEDYIVLDTSPDYVTGRVGGQQHFGSIELFKGGQHKQHTAMMVMAMLGFYFEVARHDRDKYIRVHMRHVRPDKLHHFEKIRDEATLDLPYDFKSATHPAWQFWRKIGKTGISTVATFKDKDPDGAIMRNLGQNDELLSDSDIIKINSIYGVECFTDGDSRRSSKKKNKH